MASSLYRELTENELNLIVSKALDTRIISYHLLTGGLFNTTYMVDTVRCGKTVLRVGPVNRHLLMPFEHRLMEAEAHVYTLCAEQNIPASEILYADTSKTLIDRDFMFVRYIPSKPMNLNELTPDDRARIVRDIGRATAGLHAIVGPKFGRIAEVKDGGGYDHWSDALVNELREWETVGVPAAIFTQDEHEEIRNLFETARPILDEISVPSLVHTDLWSGNILISTDTARPEFAAIIDADRSLWGDPWFDFSSIMWTHSEKDFWEGYGRPLANDEASRIRRSLYTLLNRLWNAYVYVAEYNQPDLAEKEAGDARAHMAYLKKSLAAPGK